MPARYHAQILNPRYVYSNLPPTDWDFCSNFVMVWVNYVFSFKISISPTSDVTVIITSITVYATTITAPVTIL